MLYVSTRGDPAAKRFCETLLEGLAPDGGLYMPERYPQLDAATLEQWRRLAYPELAFEVLSLYIDDIPAADLKAICAKTYTQEIFGSKEIVPLRKLEDGLYLEALSNGPTLAFKDMAMQLLGNLFEYELARRGEELNILGATSGDTGSAAEYAMRGKKGVRVFMASPHGRMSPFQQAQMFSLRDENIHNLAIEGVFDDCQDLVKAVSNDLEFKREYRIGTVNSINWARLVAQVVYFFAGYFQATRSSDERVSFAVPSGNFGNICAGHVARMMGLPIDKLVLATNENDVLDEFFRSGVYRVRPSADTFETSSPSMDIGKASNFERFVFDLVGRDAAKVRRLFAEELPAKGSFELEPDTGFGFVSGKSTHADRIATIRDTYERFEVMIDPHTVDGVKVAREHLQPGVPMVVLETALPIKFAATIVEALGREPGRPAKLQGIESLPRRVKILPADVQVLKTYIAARPRRLSSVRAPERRNSRYTIPRHAWLKGRPMTGLKLDRIDINILSQLQKNGRITNSDLAEAVALSPSPCLARVKRLEQAGYITSYNARIALDKLGDIAMVFTEVTLNDHHRENFILFEKKIRTIDEVIECHLVSGGYDYLLKFVTRGIGHYQSLMEEILDKDFGITKYFSYVVLKSPIEKLHYPLVKLFGTGPAAT